MNEWIKQRMKNLKILNDNGRDGRKEVAGIKDEKSEESSCKKFHQGKDLFSLNYW